MLTWSIMESLNEGVRSDSRGTSVRQWSSCTPSAKVHGIFRQTEWILRDDPLIAVHRKSYFLPAGWISQVVVSNISSKASIYGFCCLSHFFFLSLSRHRQRARWGRAWGVLCGYDLVSSWLRWATAANFLSSSMRESPPPKLESALICSAWFGRSGGGHQPL